MTRYASGHFSKVSCACFRLCTEYEALHKIETEGNDFINQFMQKWGKKWRQENVFRTHSHSSWWAALFFYSFHFTKYHLLPPLGAFAGMCIFFFFAQGTILPFFRCINKKNLFLILSVFHLGDHGTVSFLKVCLLWGHLLQSLICG